MQFPVCRAALARAVFALSAALLTPLASHAQPTLTDVTFWSGSAPSGEFDPAVANFWNTNPSDNPRDIFLATQPNASFTLASVVNPSTSISRPLSVGPNTFYFYASNGIVLPYYGINLFFAGSSTPSISAVTSFGGGFSPIANSTPTLRTVAFVTVPGAGTTSFPSGVYTVALTDFDILALGDGTGGAVDRVGGYSVTPEGVQDLYGRITIDVTPTAVPEPATLVLTTSGLGAIIVGRRRRRVKAATR